MKKYIVITGGAGFIGSNLCFELLKLGNSVVCMDNLSTGKKINIVNAPRRTGDPAILIASSNKIKSVFLQNLSLLCYLYQC